MDGFRYDAHPMGMLITTVAALSTFYPEAKDIGDAEVRERQIDPAHREDADASRPSPTGTASGCRTSTPTTISPTPATSST